MRRVAVEKRIFGGNLDFLRRMELIQKISKYFFPVKCLAPLNCKLNACVMCV
jgi:hypothetical protein